MGVVTHGRAPLPLHTSGVRARPLPPHAHSASSWAPPMWTPVPRKRCTEPVAASAGAYLPRSLASKLEPPDVDALVTLAMALMRASSSLAASSMATCAQAGRHARGQPSEHAADARSRARAHTHAHARSPYTSSRLNTHKHTHTLCAVRGVCVVRRVSLIGAALVMAACAADS